ncbi:hypothetical protein [Chryseobacterium luquanense]|uniref:Uncharacterized protein n=1 Tax=Chryseobacterium luquanense TaxID=2983766 RepID=A0ABT3Y3G1_9FLAO|nr:hypothetical protein [Chryseobacterium luquanense]MCX8532685.1 hypothetical protein [Chryseobacterium luquanense]
MQLWIKNYPKKAEDFPIFQQRTKQQQQSDSKIQFLPLVGNAFLQEYWCNHIENIFRLWLLEYFEMRLRFYF